jgi:hypothetical protein
MATMQEAAEKKASDARSAAEADLGGAESVSETIGQVFAGYQCGTLQVRARRGACARVPPHVLANGCPVLSTTSKKRNSDLSLPPPPHPQRGIEHPGDIAEAASLSSIPLPTATYPLLDAIGDDIVVRVGCMLLVTLCCRACFSDSVSRLLLTL